MIIISHLGSLDSKPYEYTYTPTFNFHFYLHNKLNAF